jgi:UDP-N-acetylmuramate dehydrogenase
MWMQTDGSLYAEAGNSLAKVSQFAQANGRAGLEFASGIPGTLGGGILMNAGAYGGEMKDYIRTVVAIKLEDQAMYEIEAKDCDFGYRHSLFEDGGYVILAAVFDLPEGDKDAIAEQMRTLNEKRRNSQPLDLPSCGSAFKRPVGGYAAALIEEAGLKGYSVGGAQVSEKHSGFVVNKGGATYDDIVALMDHIRKEVKKNSGITLEPEMKIYPKKMILVDQTPVEIPEELKEEFEKFKQERAKQKKDEES